MDVPLVINAPAPMAVLALFPWAANPLVRSIMECLYQGGLPPFDPELPAVNLDVLGTIADCAPVLKTR